MLTPRDIAYLACRILAFSLFILNLTQLFSQLTLIVMQLWESYRLGGDWSTFLMIALIILLTALYLGLIWLLWSNAQWISRKIVPDERNSSVWSRVRLVDLQVAAFSAIGLVFFVKGVQSITLIALHVSRVMRYVSPDETAMDWLLSGDSLYSIVGIVLGLILMVGSRGVVRMINGLRGSSRPTRDDSDAEDEPRAPQRNET